jgi:hypothetical protein
MSIVLLGSTSGSVTLQEPAVAGNTVIDLPATSGTMAVTGGSPSFTNMTATGNMTVNGNTTLGDSNTDTILMTAAPSIGGAGLGMGMGFRNRIINGAMVIDQRNAGASVTGTASAYAFPVDRFKFYNAASSKLSGQQSADAPSGFKNSIVLTSLAATTPGASDEYQLYHPIEGFNCVDLGFGTASSKTVTLSFWTKSSLTGTFSGCLSNSGARSYVFTYTINAANTWEYKTVTIAGDTTGTWNTGNGIGINILWDLGSGSNYNATPDAWNNTFECRTSGSVNLVGTNGATWYITGVQLEKGATATSFDYRPYTTELQLCERYYQRTDTGQGLRFGVQATTNAAEYHFLFIVDMRSAPTLSYVSLGNYSLYSWVAATSRVPATMTIAFSATRKCVVQVSWTTAMGSAGVGTSMDSSSGDFLAFSAEL